MEKRAVKWAVGRRDMSGISVDMIGRQAGRAGRSVVGHGRHNFYCSPFDVLFHILLLSYANPFLKPTNQTNQPNQPTNQTNQPTIHSSKLNSISFTSSNKKTPPLSISLLASNCSHPRFFLGQRQHTINNKQNTPASQPASTLFYVTFILILSQFHSPHIYHITLGKEIFSFWGIADWSAHAHGLNFIRLRSNHRNHSMRRDKTRYHEYSHPPSKILSCLPTIKILNQSK